MPLPYRWLTSLMARYNGSAILIDCGEGTQIAMKEKGWSPKPIDIMCFTHYHADHIAGLPGMLLTMGNAEKTTPLLMIGPKGLARVVNALRVIAPELPFEIQYQEITEQEQTFQFDGFRIEAFRVNHNVICYGYNIVVERKGKFQLDKALALGLESAAEGGDYRTSRRNLYAGHGHGRGTQGNQSDLLYRFQTYRWNCEKCKGCRPFYLRRHVWGAG